MKLLKRIIRRLFPTWAYRKDIEILENKRRSKYDALIDHEDTRSQDYLMQRIAKRKSTKH